MSEESSAKLLPPPMKSKGTAMLRTKANIPPADNSAMSEEKQKSIPVYLSVYAVRSVLKGIIRRLKEDQDNKASRESYTELFTSIENMIQEFQANQSKDASEEITEEIIGVCTEFAEELRMIRNTTKNRQVRKAIEEFFENSTIMLRPINWPESKSTIDEVLTLDNTVITSNQEVKIEVLLEKTYKTFINLFGFGIVLLIGLSIGGVINWIVSLPSVIVCISAMLTLGSIYNNNINLHKTP